MLPPLARRLSSALALLVLAWLTLVVGASDATAQDEPAPTEAPATEPPATEAPPSGDGGGDGGDGADDGAGDETDDGDSTTWVLAVVVGVGAVVVLALVGSALGRSSSRRRAVHDAERQQLRHVLGGATWVHDQASIEIIGGGGQSPERLRMGWEDTRRRINDLGSECATLALQSDPPTGAALSQLGQALGALSGALDTNVSLRLRTDLDDPSVGDALRASNEAVEARRRDLAGAITSLRPWA